MRKTVSLKIFSLMVFACLTGFGVAYGGESGYYIFEYRPTATNNYPTAYDEVEDDQYLFGYSFPTDNNFKNPTVSNQVVWVDEGVGKLKEAEFGVAPSDANNHFSQGAALGIKNNPIKENTPNLSDCEAISYYYKGETHSFNVDFPGTECNGTAGGDGSNKWGVETISASSSNWAQKTVQKADLKLYNTWTGSNASICGTENGQVNPTVDLSKATQIVWELNNKKSPNEKVSLMITNVVCLYESDGEFPTDSPNEEITVYTGKLAASSSSSGNASSSSSANNTTTSSSSNSTTTNSSSSVNAQNNSSSSSNTNINNNSSSSGGTGNSQGDKYCVYGDLKICTSHAADYICPNGGLESLSCPAGYDGSTPIILSHQVYSNALSVMQNAVNLQIMGNATVQVFDLKGNAVRTLSFAQGNYIVPLSGLPRGLYIIKANSASWSKTITVPIK